MLQNCNSQIDPLNTGYAHPSRPSLDLNNDGTIDAIVCATLYSKVGELRLVSDAATTHG